MNRNLKLINHWIAEVRDLARNHKPRLRIETPYKKNKPFGKKREIAKPGEECLYVPMPYKDIKYVFSRDVMKPYFDEGMTPKEALAEEISYWD